MRLHMRNPKGRFIWRGEALQHWLPTMLGWCGNSLIDAMDLMIRYCEKEASNQLSLGAKFLLDEAVQKVDAPELYWWNVKIAETWGARRSVLVEAKAKLEKLR